MLRLGTIFFSCHVKRPNFSCSAKRRKRGAFKVLCNDSYLGILFYLLEQCLYQSRTYNQILIYHWYASRGRRSIFFLHFLGQVASLLMTHFLTLVITKLCYYSLTHQQAPFPGLLSFQKCIKLIRGLHCCQPQNEWSGSACHYLSIQ